MRLQRTLAFAAASVIAGGLATNAMAATEIQWWHAMGITISGDLV